MSRVKYSEDSLGYRDRVQQRLEEILRELVLERVKDREQAVIMADDVRACLAPAIHRLMEELDLEDDEQREIGARAH
jgi:hypothetical protein